MCTLYYNILPRILWFNVAAAVQCSPCRCAPWTLPGWAESVWPLRCPGRWEPTRCCGSARPADPRSAQTNKTGRQRWTGPYAAHVYVYYSFTLDIYSNNQIFLINILTYFSYVNINIYIFESSYCRLNKYLFFSMDQLSQNLISPPDLAQRWLSTNCNNGSANQKERN